MPYDILQFKPSLKIPQQTDGCGTSNKATPTLQKDPILHLKWPTVQLNFYPTVSVCKIHGFSCQMIYHIFTFSFITFSRFVSSMHFFVMCLQNEFAAKRFTTFVTIEWFQILMNRPLVYQHIVSQKSFFHKVHI